MSRSLRMSAIALSALVGASMLQALVSPPSVRAQSPSPAFPSPSLPPDSTMCGADPADVALLVDGRVARTTPYWSEEDPAPELATDVIDSVGGWELEVELLADWSGAVQTPLPVDSVKATLTIGDGPAMWLVTRAGGDQASIMLPLVVGEGELAHRVGACGWSLAGRYPIIVSDPDLVAACPTDRNALEAYLGEMDQRATVSGDTLPSLGILNVRARHAPVQLGDEGSYAGYPYDPATPIVRARGGSRITIRPEAPGLEVLAPNAGWAKVPPRRELREGLVQTIENAGPSADPRPGGSGGLSVRVPKRPGRYMSVSTSTWRDACVTVTESATLFLVESRS